LREPSLAKRRVESAAAAVIPEQVAVDGRQWKMLCLCTYESIPGTGTHKSGKKLSVFDIID